MTGDRVRAARMRSQRLEEPIGDPAELVRHLGGVQAQDPRAGALSIRARTAGVTASGVRRALEDERSIVRTWAMRGTIHFVHSEDARWLHDLLAPIAMPAEHRALDRLEVPQAQRLKAVDVIVKALGANGPITRAELNEHLERAGIDTSGRRAAHLPRLAALEGHVCFGPMRGSKDTYALIEDWIPGRGPRLDRHEALAELARRYAAAYGPAEVTDMAAWAGLPTRELRAAWRAPAHDDRAVPDPPIVRMLPAFDTYMLGYRNRDLAVPAAHAKRVWPGGGIVRPAIVANGLAVGTWRRAGSKITVEPFGPDVDAGDELADIDRFLNG